MHLIFVIMLFVSCVARAGDIKDVSVPVSRIYNAVQSYSDLYNSPFVFLVRDRIDQSSGKITLGELAQLCVGFLGVDTVKTCQEFMRAVIGGTGASEDDWKFTAKFESVGSVNFKIVADGTFYIDCGDGIKTEIAGDREKGTDVSCGNTNEIKIGGTATAYSDDANVPVINFINNKSLVEVSGSLGGIFPTLNAASPRFVGTFWGCEKLATISDTLFSGITGSGVENMFWGTFGETAITIIPDGLFDDMSNISAERMFAMTFYGCDKLTSIPTGLFSKVNVGAGLPEKMFYGTFANCTNVQGGAPQINGTALDKISDWGKVETACFCNTQLSDVSNTWK